MLPDEHISRLIANSAEIIAQMVFFSWAFRVLSGAVLVRSLLKLASLHFCGEVTLGFDLHRVFVWPLACVQS